MSRTWWIIRVVVTLAIIAVIWWLAWHGGTWRDLPILVFLLWLVLPLAHPCDYNSYRQWWADKRNWTKKGYL